MSLNVVRYFIVRILLAKPAGSASKSKASALTSTLVSKIIYLSTEFLISVYIPAAASVDVTAETKSLTNSPDRKHAILSRAKISIRYQISNNGRGVRYRSFARYPISKA